MRVPREESSKRVNLALGDAMKTARTLGFLATMVLILFISPLPALAQASSAGVLDTAHDAYMNAASNWASTIEAHAARLFWLLALISMVWTFGIMLLRKADIGEFFAEFVRFTIFVGFFWWLLDNGPHFASTIIASLRQMGDSAAAAASGSSSPMSSPSAIVDIGFEIFAKVVDKSTVWSPFTSAVGIALSIIILLVLALVAVNMLVLMVSAWVLAYAGIFFLGFGGSRWTSDMAINYFRTVLAMAAQIFTMVLLIGIAKAIIDDFYSHMSSDMNLSEIAAVMIVAIILLVLVNKLPPLVGGLATGGGVAALGGGAGAAHAVAAMTGAAAAMSIAATALTTTVANAIGAGSSVHEAFKRALEHESSAETRRDATNSQSQSGSSMNQEGFGPAWSGGSNGANDASTPRQKSNDSTAAGSHPQDSNDKEGRAHRSGGAQHSSSMMQKGAKAARIGAGTLGNLGAGVLNTAKGAVMERASNSMAGSVARTIKASAAREKSNEMAETNTSKNSLSAGDEEKFDPADEIAAFRDRSPYDEGDVDGEHVS